MKIEKISDNQIKCTLTKQDLEERSIRLSELVYGSDKAKQLFKDMLHMAAIEYGFDGEEMPIMVEAIPSSRDSLVLIITKVENPEELDTRFSHFTPGNEEETEEIEEEEIFSDNALQDADKDAGKEPESTFKDALERMKQVAAGKNKTVENNGKGISPIPPENQYRTFRFDNMEQVLEFSRAAYLDYKGVSNLYKDTVKGKYYMVIFLKGTSVANFNQACNIASEYGTILTGLSLAFYNEHYKLIAKDDAVERIAVML